MSTNNEKEEIEKMIRSILSAFKGGCELRTLESQYHEFSGGPLPYRKYNFASALELLRALPNAVQITNKAGVTLLRVVDVKETQHITDFVRRQNSSKKSTKRAAPYRSRGRGILPSVSLRGRGYGAGRGRAFPSKEVFRKTPADVASNAFRSPPTSIRPQPVQQRWQRPAEPFHRFDAPSSSYRPSYSATAKSELEQAARRCCLSVPTFSILRVGNKFSCSVQVGDHRCGSQSTFATREEAEAAAAESALKILRKTYSVLNESAGQAPLKKEDDFERFVENVLVLLEDHPTGIISSYLPGKYALRFGAILPDNWLSELDENAPEISVDPVINTNLCIVAKKLVSSPPPLSLSPPKKLLSEPSTSFFTNIVPLIVATQNKEPAQAMASFSAEPKNLPPKIVDVEIKMGSLDETLPERRVAFDEAKNEVLEIALSSEEREYRKSSPIFLPNTLPLRLHEDEFFNAIVTIAINPSDFYIRINEPEYAASFSNLRTKMDDFYNNNEGDRIELEEDFHKNRPLYAALADDCWNRVSVVSVSAESQTALVQFVDHGDLETLPWSSIRQLEPEFVSFPAQAVRAQLVGFGEDVWTNDDGLFDFDAELVDKFQSLVVDRVLLAHLSPAEPAAAEGEYILNPGSFYDRYLSPRLSLVLYGDDAESPDGSVCINEIIEKIISGEKYDQVMRRMLARRKLVQVDASSLIGQDEPDSAPQTNLNSSAPPISASNDPKDVVDSMTSSCDQSIDIRINELSIKEEAGSVVENNLISPDENLSNERTDNSSLLEGQQSTTSAYAALCFLSFLFLLVFYFICLVFKTLEPVVRLK